MLAQIQSSKRKHRANRQVGENKGLPVFIHLASRQDALDMVRLVNRYPDACFIIAHMIGMEVFAQAELQNKNVYFDMSGGQLIPQKKLLIAIEKFGAEKS